MTRVVINLTQVLVAVAVAGTSLCNIIVTRHDRTVLYPHRAIEATKTPSHEAIITTTLPPAPYVRESCSSPYMRIARQCLSIRQIVNATWEGARDFCRALDGDLVVAASFQDLLLGYVNAYSSFSKMFHSSMWIGARRPDAHSSFRWLDGSDLPPLTSPLWDYQDNDDYNCVYLGLHLNKTYTYRNGDCKDMHRMTCQCLAC